LALQACGGLADLLDGGDQQADEDGDDRNHHQQLDQREGMTALSWHRRSLQKRRSRTTGDKTKTTGRRPSAATARARGLARRCGAASSAVAGRGGEVGCCFLPGVGLRPVRTGSAPRDDDDEAAELTWCYGPTVGWPSLRGRFRSPLRPVWVSPSG